MNNGLSDFFAPLDKDYCALFYWLTVVNFIFLIVAALGFVVSLVMLFRSKVTLMSVLYSFLMILVYGLMYYQSRLFYSMCVTGNMKAGTFLNSSGAGDSLPSAAKNASMAAPGSLRM
jgi:hypothetical protein